MIKNISIIISSDHPINPIVEKWVSSKNNNFDIEIVRSPICRWGSPFFNQLWRYYTSRDIEKYKKSLVIHASNLPKGADLVLIWIY